MKRALSFLILASLLSACGGHSGPGPNPPGPTPTGTPTATPPPPPVSTQKSVAAQSLQALAIGQILAGGFAGPNASLLSFLKQGAGSLTQVTKRPEIITNQTPPPLSPCANGTEYAKQANATVTQIWIETYYDSQCTTLFSEVYAEQSLLSQNGTTKNLAVDEIQQLFQKTGTQVAYNTVSAQLVVDNGSLSAVTEQVASQVNQNSPTLSNVGLSCTYVNGAANACGSGSITHSLTEDLGTTLAFPQFSVTQTSDGGTQYSLTGNVTTYTGAINGLVLSPVQNSIDWSIGGGTQGGSSNMSGTFDFSAAGVADGGTITTTDTPDDIEVIVTTASDGSMTGSIKRISTGAGVATFTLDATGNGSITFADGTTATIQNFGLAD